MPSRLHQNDDDADVPPPEEDPEVLQYRGPEIRVVAEPAGMDGVRLVFDSIEKFGGQYQKPYPVVPDDAANPPDDAILRSVADRLVETSPVFHYGAACPAEDCDDVFPTLDGLTSHYAQVHGEAPTADADAGGDAE